MKKALILSLGRNGGLPLYTSLIVQNFKNIDFDVLISKQATININTEKTIKIATYTNKYSFVFNTLFYLPIKFILLLPRLISQYKILYLPYDHFWSLPFVVLFRILGRRVVLTIHDGILHTGENNKILQWENDLKIKLATDYIFLTKFVRDQVSKRFSFKKPSFVVPHGLYENNFLKIKNERSRKNILFVGRIGRYKGVELLIESANELLDKFDRLIIAGKSLYQLEYNNSIDKIELRNKYLSEKEIGELLSWADILVIPYLEATQSGVITLGILAELPMVCTRVGGLLEQLNEDECVWVDPNKDSLVNGLDTLISDQSKYEELRKKLTIKKQDLSWDKISKEIENILN